jgi:hypothetical protein
MTISVRVCIARWCLLLLLILLIVMSGCSSQSNASKGAKEGATTGAVAGAVGGVVGALVFGGNVGDAAARGAVYGGTVGAVSGGMSGSKRDKAEAEQAQSAREAQAEKLRKDIGEDAYNAVAALAECKHAVASANADVAKQSNKADFRLAGMWVDVLIYADQQREAEARALFPQIIPLDRDIKNEAQAEAAMRNAMQQLMDIREEFGLPRVCDA